MAGVTRLEITDEWIRARRQAAQLYGEPMRASPAGNAIEVKVKAATNQWGYLMLPGQRKEFESSQVRDEVLSLLVGSSGVA